MTVRKSRAQNAAHGSLSRFSQGIETGLELGPHVGEEHAAGLGEALGELVVLVEQVGAADSNRGVGIEGVLGLEVHERVRADPIVVGAGASGVRCPHWTTKSRGRLAGRWTG